MEFQTYSRRAPKLNLVLITGGMLSGKTTLAAKFAKDPSRVAFVSTDGNALNQGYRGIKFEFPKVATDMKKKIVEVFDLLTSNNDHYDVVVWDLIEDFDEAMQTLLREELENPKKSQKAWGKINGLYGDLQTMMKTNLEDKTVVFLSRENTIETKNRFGDVVKVEYIPVLRKVLQNKLLKDPDAELRVFKDDNGNHKVEVVSLRYHETQQTLADIINKPVVEPSVEPTLEERIESLMLSAERRATELNGAPTKLTEEQRKEFFASKTFDEAKNYIKVWATENVKSDSEEESTKEGTNE